MSTQSEPVPSQFDEWVNRNPLRQWRKERRVSIMQAASQLGASMTIVQLWERGVHIPGDDFMVKLEVMVGRGCSAHWNEWYNNKPSPVGAA